MARTAPVESKIFANIDESKYASEFDCCFHFFFISFISGGNSLAEAAFQGPLQQYFTIFTFKSKQK